MHFFLSLIIPLASFFLQSYPRFFNRYFGVDVWTRLIEIEQVRQAGHKIPGKIKKGFIIEGYFDYPIIFPWIFSFFDKRFLLRIQGFVSPFFDAMQNVLLYTVAYQLTANIQISLLSQLIYTLNPMIPIENSYLTPRSMGYLNFTLAFYPLLLFHVNNQIIFLILGFLFSMTLFLTHRFALQSLLFISIFFTFVDQSPAYLASFFFAAVAIILLTKGFYLTVAKGHVYNIYFWVLNYRYRFSHQIHGNTAARKVDWVAQIYSLLSNLSPIFLVVLDIWILSAFIYLFLYTKTSSELPKNIVLYKMSIWVIFFYVIGSVILRVKRLLPIGEGQRYLEMASVPASILSAVLFYYFYNLFGAIILFFFLLLCAGYLVFILFIQIKAIIKDKNRSLTKELQKAYDFINKLPKKPRIMCIPHQITTMTIYNTKADVLVNADNPGLMRITEFYPILKTPISDLAKKYQLDYLLLRESFANLSDLKLKRAKIAFKSGDVLLVKL